MQSHLVPLQVAQPTRRSLPRELQAGVGAEELHIRQSDAQVLDLWGNPDKKERIDSSTYFIYRSLNLEVEFRDHRVHRLFFFGSKNGRNATLSICGIGFGATRQA